MPARKQRQSSTRANELSDLPRRADLIVEGSLRPLGVYFQEGKQTVQPLMALWVDGQQGFVRGTAMINPLESDDDGIGEALDALRTALAAPSMFGQAPGAGSPARKPAIATGQQGGPLAPALPGLVRTDHAGLADAARALLAPLGITVEHVETAPAVDMAFESLAAFMGADPDAEPPEPFSWDIDPALLPPLYRATAEYTRKRPWTYMPDYPPVAIALGKHGPEKGVQTLYACVMGGGGMVNGVAFYYDLDALDRAVETGDELTLDDDEVAEQVELLRQAGAPVDGLPPEALHDLVAQFMTMDEEGGPTLADAMEDGLVFFLDAAREYDPTYLDWLKEHGVTYPARLKVPIFFRTSQGGDSRTPNAREVTALTLAVEALNQFFDAHKSVLKGPDGPLERHTHTATVRGGDQEVAAMVTFPPPEFRLMPISGLGPIILP